jgi:hypothetical protein
MAVTPNYSWPVPVATDYVKDGWEAISDLGNAIDTTVAGLGSSGLTLITSQSFSASSAVNINSCFSSNYQNYKVMLIITANTGGGEINMRMRSGTTDNSSANYWYNRIYSTGSSGSIVTQGNSTAATSISFVNEFSQGISTSSIEVYCPFETKYTAITNQANFRYNVAGAYQHTVSMTGQVDVTNSYDGFSIIPTTGTLTGNIRVFGYKN